MSDAPISRRFPEPPAELWGLWSSDGGEDERGSWWQHGQTSADGPMVFTSREDAERAAEDEAEDHAMVMGFGVTLIPLLIGVRPVPAEVAS